MSFFWRARSGFLLKLFAGNTYIGLLAKQLRDILGPWKRRLSWHIQAGRALLERVLKDQDDDRDMTIVMPAPPDPDLSHLPVATED